MKHLIALSLVLVSLTVTSHAQEVTNDIVQKRIVAAHAQDSIALTFDSGSSKIMAVSENFTKEETNRAGILTMNLAVGLIYPGDSLAKAPDSFLLTFWVLSKKPRFGSNHALTIALKDEMLVIGGARYTAKPREQMEYLNFEISRESLTRIAGLADVRFRLGDDEFTFTRRQMKLFADLLVVTEAGGGQ